MEEKDKNIENFSNENDIKASSEEALSASMFGDVSDDGTIDESMFADVSEATDGLESVFEEQAEEISKEDVQEKQDIDESCEFEANSEFDIGITEEIKQENNETEVAENVQNDDLNVELTENFAKESSATIQKNVETKNIDILPMISDSEEFEEPIKELITVRPVKFQQFEEMEPNRTIKKNLDILQDISMHVSVELGRTKTSIREVMEMESGSIVELDKIAGEQVEIFVNDKLVAKGEVIVIEDKFGVRITSTSLANSNQAY